MRRRRKYDAGAVSEYWVAAAARAFARRHALTRLAIDHDISTTTASATNGASSASDAIRTDPASSRVARIGLPRPAVAAELFSRSSDVEACTRPAVPPAPMMAIEYCSQGGRSVSKRGARDDARHHRERRGQRIEQVVEKRDVVRRDFENRCRRQGDRRRRRREPGERRRQCHPSGLRRQAERQQRNEDAESRRGRQRQPDADTQQRFGCHNRYLGTVSPEPSPRRARRAEPDGRVERPAPHVSGRHPARLDATVARSGAGAGDEP